MASEKGVIASGLESGSQSTRRRNVPSTSANVGMVNRVEIDDKKTQVKKVSTLAAANDEPSTFPPAGANLSSFNRRSKHY